MLPQAGDIVFYPVSSRSSFVSKLVAIGELLGGKTKGFEEYSHVAILEDETHTLEARWPRTCRYHLDKSRPYEIWTIDGITQSERGMILHWAYMHLNEWYSLPSLLTFGLLRSKRTEVCSTFVAHALEAAEVTHRKWGQFTTPNDLKEIVKMKLIYTWSGRP